MPPALTIIHVDDSHLFLHAVQGHLEGIPSTTLISVESLKCLEDAIQGTRIHIGILDGNFLDRPGGKLALRLSTAFDLLKTVGAQAIYVLSSESLKDLREHLDGREPDGIFGKAHSGEGVMGIERIGEVIAARVRELHEQDLFHQESSIFSVLAEHQ